MVVAFVVEAVAVVSGTGEIKLISHTFHPVDFSPGFASSISLHFSVEQSHDALQIGVPCVLPVKNPSSNLEDQLHSLYAAVLTGVCLSTRGWGTPVSGSFPGHWPRSFLGVRPGQVRTGVGVPLTRSGRGRGTPGQGPSGQVRTGRKGVPQDRVPPARTTV